MAMQEEVVEEIRKLRGELLSPTIDADERVAIRNQIASENNKLTALIKSQQGKSSRISIAPSQSSRCNPLPNLFRHLIITHPGSVTTTQGKG